MGSGVVGARPGAVVDGADCRTVAGAVGGPVREGAGGGDTRGTGVGGVGGDAPGVAGGGVGVVGAPVDRGAPVDGGGDGVVGVDGGGVGGAGVVAGGLTPPVPIVGSEGGGGVVVGVEGGGVGVVGGFGATLGGAAGVPLAAGETGVVGAGAEAGVGGAVIGVLAGGAGDGVSPARGASWAPPLGDARSSGLLGAEVLAAAAGLSSGLAQFEHHRASARLDVPHEGHRTGRSGAPEGWVASLPGWLMASNIRSAGQGCGASRSCCRARAGTSRRRR